MLFPIKDPDLEGQTVCQTWVTADGGIGNSKHEHIQVLPSVLSDLHRRVMKAEATLRQKEDENETLQQQLKQYERRWLEYEKKKMKSIEETWQRQFTTSLQILRLNLSAWNVLSAFSTLF